MHIYKWRFSVAVTRWSR